MQFFFENDLFRIKNWAFHGLKQLQTTQKRRTPGKKSDKTNGSFVKKIGRN